MKRVDVFPTSVFCAQLGFPGNGEGDGLSKAELVEHVLAMRERSEPPTANIAAWTGDVRGFEFIHKDPAFAPLFASSHSKRHETEGNEGPLEGPIASFAGLATSCSTSASSN